MLLSAVKLGLVLLSVTPQGGLSGREAGTWKRIQPSVAYIGNGPKADAVCVLIDDSGLYVAVEGNLKGDSFAGSAGDRHFSLKRLSSDVATGLILLQADPWTYGQGRVAYLTGKPVNQKQDLFVALPAGPIRAEFVRSDRVGVLTQSHRMFTLNELRFEAPASEVAGGIVFTESGELVGAVSATLQGAPQNQQASRSGGAGGGGLGQANLDAAPPTGFSPKLSIVQSKTYGPNDQTIAYTVGLNVMRRVVEGFRSPSHEVQHPSIGVFCKDSQLAGALVSRVREDGAGAKAGIQVGDIILSMNGRAIKNQIGFASFMSQTEVGQQLVVWVLRNSLQVRLVVPVGKS